MWDRVVIRDWTKGTDKDYEASQFPLGHNSICMQIVCVCGGGGSGKAAYR